MANGSRWQLVEEYTEVLKDYLKGKRNYTKTMFKVMGTIWRGSEKGRFTLDEGINVLNKI